MEHGRDQPLSLPPSAPDRLMATTRANRGTDDAGPRRPAATQQRKEQVLTKGRATTVSSIADALVAKDGEPFLVCRTDGQVPVAPGHGYGFYHNDCRYLAGYELAIAGSLPEPLAASEATGARLIVELTNPPFDDPSLHVAKEQLGIRWTREVDRSGPVLHDRIVVRNYGTSPVELPLSVRFRAGFEDVFVIRGLLDERPGAAHDPRWDGDVLEFRYDGGDDVTRTTRIRFDPAPPDRLPKGADFRLPIPPRRTAKLEIIVEVAEHAHESSRGADERGSPPSRPAAREPRRAAVPSVGDGEWIGQRGWATAARTSSFALRAALECSLDDLNLLRSSLDGQRYYEAGIPWFATLFGRDSLIAAYQSLPFDPEIAAETLRLLAHRRGRTIDEFREEQPGKILHELRIGELARMGEIPHTPYYGSIDATLLFLIVLARHAAWTGSLDVFRELREAVDAALAWVDLYGDTDGDGFIDYSSTTHRGLVNQGWKDSGDAIVDARGDIATPPIALAEVQGYAWRAWREIARLRELDGDPAGASRLRAKAGALREAFEDRFWSDDLGCYVLALAHGDRCEVVTSNAGQVLWSGIAQPEHARRVADRLMRDDMFSGWGIRTLSSDAVAFHPIGYHLGTVWPHDNSLVAEGFRRFGRDDAAEQVFLGLLEAAQDFGHDRLPECFAGFARQGFDVPVRYPVACHPQAWAAGAIPSLLLSTLGIEPDGFNRRLIVRRPRLPVGIEWVELKGLPIAGSRVHLRFERLRQVTRMEVVDGGDRIAVTADDGPDDQAV
jgi:glycogen debranching enzyme